MLAWPGFDLARKIMDGADPVNVVMATKHGVLLILCFHVFYFHSSSTSILLELVEKSVLMKNTSIFHLSLNYYNV